MNVNYWYNRSYYSTHTEVPTDRQDLFENDEIHEHGSRYGAHLTDAREERWRQCNAQHDQIVQWKTDTGVEQEPHERVERGEFEGLNFRAVQHDENRPQ